MRQRRDPLIAIILLVILGVFLIISITSSRKVMMDLLKDEARSFLSLISLAQENSIFAEASLEDQIIDELIGIVNYLGYAGFNRTTLAQIRQNFGLSSIMIFESTTKRVVAKSGNPVKISENIFKPIENIFFEYYIFRNEKYIRFIYHLDQAIFQIELSAEAIKRFSQEYGINNILNQISLNPMIKYLVFQDPKGIIFATPNIKTLSRIEGDSILMGVLGSEKEAARVIQFENKNILELIQPFAVDDKVLGIFRIGVSLESYYQHIKKTQTELVVFFIIIFVIGFFLFFFFMKYQNFLNLEELFSKTLRTINEGVILVDAKGKITGVNRMFCAITNFEEKILLHNNYHRIFEADPFSINFVLQNRTRHEEEKVLFDKNIQYASHPLFNQQKMVAGVISVLRDVTKIREFEKEQKEAERLSFLGNLVANFAHEIKNPLNGLSIAAQRLTKEFPSEDLEYRELTNTLIKEIDSLNKVLNDFLSLVRPQIKEKQQFSLTQVVQGVVNLIKGQIKERGFILKEDIAQNVKFTGYPDDMRRAILNIMLNAVDAVSETSGRNGEVTIELLAKKKNILIKISDNGKGMDKTDQDKIFNPYFTTKKGGTGLGLYIAQKIIKEHQGKITVKSELQKGTTFKISFPV